MDGLYYVLGNLFVCFIVFWGMINDRVPRGGRTTGLLAMPAEENVARSDNTRRQPD